MKAGGDKDGIWTIMESSLQYVVVPGAPFTHLSSFLSISSVVSHVPYLMEYFIAVMGRGGSVQRAITFGTESVLGRLKVGANRKDLFYYLVRQHTGSDVLIHWNHCRVARSSLKPSAPLSKTLPIMGHWLLLPVRTQRAASSRPSSITCYSIQQHMSTYKKKSTRPFQMEKSPWTQ
jgi:hypothetical protein